MKTKSLRTLLKSEEPLLLPCAYDALSALLIERSGFEAIGIGGFGLIASRLGLPDIGLASLGEIAAGMRDIRAAIRIPMLVDADDGYGDVKNVARTVRIYEEMGVDGILLEDQTNPKRCGHMAGKTVVSRQMAQDKLKAALDARLSEDFVIVARTDARGPLGLDEALERGENFQTLGADALLIEAPEDEEELARIGRTFRIPLVAACVEGGTTPVLAPAHLRRLGFGAVIYPTAVLWRVMKTMQGALRELRAGELPASDDLPTFNDMNSLLGTPYWAGIEDAVKPA